MQHQDLTQWTSEHGVHKSEIRAPSKLWDSVSLVKITSQPVEFQLNACRAHTGSKAQGAWCASWGTWLHSWVLS